MLVNRNDAINGNLKMCRTEQLLGSKKYHLYMARRQHKRDVRNNKIYKRGIIALKIKDYFERINK